MSNSASRLTDLLLSSGVSRIAFLGLAKNAGKTTALVSVLAELARRGVVAGATSAGRDGEEFDAITGELKPRFRLHRGQLVASAAQTFETASLPSDLLDTLPFHTRFGPIEVRHCRGEGEIEVIGPSTASEMAHASEALERAGAKLVLLDGAIGRRAFASARVAGGIVLSAGLAAGSSLVSAIEAARLAVELINLKPPPLDHSLRNIAGALTDAELAADPPREGEVLVVEDFASIFLSPDRRRRLHERHIELAVRRPARLLAVTSNPTAPARLPIDAGKFLDALHAELAGLPIFDVVAQLAAESD